MRFVFLISPLYIFEYIVKYWYLLMLLSYFKNISVCSLKDTTFYLYEYFGKILMMILIQQIFLFSRTTVIFE